MVLQLGLPSSWPRCHPRVTESEGNCSGSYASLVWKNPERMVCHRPSAAHQSLVNHLITLVRIHCKPGALPPGPSGARVGASGGRVPPGVPARGSVTYPAVPRPESPLDKHRGTHHGVGAAQAVPCHTAVSPCAWCQHRGGAHGDPRVPPAKAPGGRHPEGGTAAVPGRPRAQ